MRDKFEGAVYGALIGDAFGVPYEFKDSSEIPKFDLLHLSMRVSPSYDRSWPQIQEGTWSDDGSQMLCLLEHLLKGRYDHLEFARTLVRWMTDGYMSVDSYRFDIGMQTVSRLDRILCGEDVYKFRYKEHENGNGSLMRCLPVGLLLGGSECCRVAELQSEVTHGHGKSIVCCVIYSLLVSNLMIGQEFSIALVNALADAHWYFAGGENEVWYEAVLDESVNVPKGSGYVVDSFWSSIWAVKNSKSFTEAIVNAVSLGNDTDTTACIAGGLAGAVYGKVGIPERMIFELRGKDIVNRVLEKRNELRY